MTAAINDLSSFYSNLKQNDAVKVGKTSLIWLSPDEIEEEEGFNLRDYDRADTIEHIENLAKAWASGAQMPPLEVKVKDGRCFVRDGHCRLRAARLANTRGAGIRRVSVIELKGNEDEANIRLLTSNDSLKLTPIQRAHGYRRLRNMGWELFEIARELKTSDTNIREACRLLDLPREIQQLIEDGAIAPLFGLKLFRTHGAAEALRLIGLAIERRKQEEETDGVDNASAGDAGAGNGDAKPKPAKVIRVSSKHIAKLTNATPKAFLKEIVPHFRQLKSHLVSSAKVDKETKQISLSLPKDVYDEFLKIASLLTEQSSPAADSDPSEEQQESKQLEIPT